MKSLSTFHSACFCLGCSGSCAVVRALPSVSPVLKKHRDLNHEEPYPEWFANSSLLFGPSPLETQMKSLLYELTVVDLLSSIEQKTVFSCTHPQMPFALKAVACGRGQEL